MTEIVPSYEHSLEFLTWWCPGGPWVLTAVSQDKESISARTFGQESVSSLLGWLTKHGAHSNIYYHVNPLLREVEKKAEKVDVKQLSWLHIDVDPRAGEDIAEERKRILKMLRGKMANVPPPSCIVFSGGGYQAFWRLEEPLPIDGDESAAEDAERYNRMLEILYGADSCHNLDRIMRLPGTVNRPSTKKKKLGRVDVLASLVEKDDSRVYQIGLFTKAPLLQGITEGFSSGKIKVSGNVRRLNDIEELGDKVSRYCKEIIVQGQDNDNPKKWPSRSECLFWVICELVRSDVDDNRIYSVITDPGFAISRSVLDKKSRSDKYALRQIERARENAVDPWLRICNERHAVIGSIGGKCRIITEEEDSQLNRTRISYQNQTDFKLRYGNKIVSYVNSSGNSASISVGTWWLRHPQRREYDSIVFAPGRDVPGSYNLWKGFAYEAIPGGSCQRYLDHVKSNICKDDELNFNYILGWMATAVQKPDSPGYTAIVLRGNRGTGKSVFAKTFGKLFGRHYFHVSDPKHLVGSFNAHLRDCVVLFGDEAFYAGDKKHESVLKMLVTEDMITIESKGVDAEAAPNYVHLIMASNEKWVVPAGRYERRFLVLDVGDEVRQNNSYFALMQDELNAGGYEALLHYLMSYDLTDYDIRAIPKTSALQDQMVLSFGPDEEWWYAKLMAGEIFDGMGWPQFVFASHLTFDYTTYTRLWNLSNRGNSSRLGKFMMNVLPNDGKPVKLQLGGKHEVVGEDGSISLIDRPRAYRIASLIECRENFDLQYGGPYDWPKSINGQELESFGD